MGWWWWWPQAFYWVLCTFHDLYKEEDTESTRNSTPMSDISLAVCTEFRVCSLPWLQLIEPPT